MPVLPEVLGQRWDADVWVMIDLPRLDGTRIAELVSFLGGDPADHRSPATLSAGARPPPGSGAPPR